MKPNYMYIYIYIFNIYRNNIQQKRYYSIFFSKSKNLIKSCDLLKNKKIKKKNFSRLLNLKKPKIYFFKIL